MTDADPRCQTCQALLDPQDLFCANCGAETPRQAAEGEIPAAARPRHTFACQGCGASMIYDAQASALRCPYCGSEQLRPQPSATTLAPRLIVPFALDRETAAQTLRRWLGQGFWRPGDLASAALVTHMTAVYVPFWMFEAQTWTYWTADSSQTPPGARGNWLPVAGERHDRHEGLLVSASSVLTAEEISAIRPFDLSHAPAADQLADQDVAVEEFRVLRKYARPSAREELEQRERAACAAAVPGHARNVKVNVRLEGFASQPVLLPVWIMAYRYRQQVYRFLINGQTGKPTGMAPVSAGKIAAALAAGAAGLILLWILLSAIGA